MMVNMLSPTG